MLGLPETPCQFDAPSSEVASSRKFVPVAGQDSVTSFPVRTIFNEWGMCQRAILLAGLAPAMLNGPPAKTSEPFAAKPQTAAPSGPPPIPLPKGHQEPSLHSAM